MISEKRSLPRFQAGDWVVVRCEANQVQVQVVEDRGPLGMRGRRFCRVRLDQDPDEPVLFEMPEEQMELASPLDKQRIIRYLEVGGLAKILQANLLGGRSQQRVWLTVTSQGETIHTFTEERGQVGGETVPFFALHNGKVFTPRQEEVIRFLMSFGLTRVEAGAVLHVIGTSP